MRFTRILLVASAALFVSASATSAVPYNALDAAPAVTVVTLSAEQTQPPPKAEIKVDIDTGREVVWYTDPVWLAVGAIALLVIIVLAVMAARGGGGTDHTTVVR